MVVVGGGVGGEGGSGTIHLAVERFLSLSLSRSFSLSRSLCAFELHVLLTQYG